MDSAWEWKQYYADERRRLGRDALLELIDTTPPVPLDAGGAIVVPHTRLEVTGHQIAAAVNAIVASAARRVLALGVLHGARRSDAERVAAARAGDHDATRALRGIHTVDGLASEEFSLDAFTELLALASERAGVSIEIVERYPFLVGDDPASVPGIDALAGELGAGTMLVATTDPMHHGHAYGTPAAACLAADRPVTFDVARASVESQLATLSTHRYGEFQALAARDRSDFRDTGPVLAHLLGRPFRATIHDLALVDYASALGAATPSWVAGALVTV